MIARKKILIVEDDLLNMKLTADLLEFNGFEVVKAVDGPSTLHLLHQVQPDLILLDLQLPGMDGFEILDKIRANEKTKNLKVVVMTASVTKEDEQRIVVKSFNGYISKPIDTRAFIKTIKAMTS